MKIGQIAELSIYISSLKQIEYKDELIYLI